MRIHSSKDITLLLVKNLSTQDNLSSIFGLLLPTTFRFLFENTKMLLDTALFALARKISDEIYFWDECKIGVKHNEYIICFKTNVIANSLN